MIFTSQDTLALHRKLWMQVEAGEITDEAAFRRALEADPADARALFALGYAARLSGDLEQAEALARRGLEAHPADHRFYLLLADILFDSDPPLAVGLMELGLRAGEGEEIMERESRRAAEQLGLPPEVGRDALLAAYETHRTSEPVAVTEALRSYRLVLEILESEGLDPSRVDEILADGSAVAPLLVGLLRDWADEVVDDDFPAHVALALLGEIGDPAALPALVEFAALDDAALARAAAWAIQRIAARRPRETLDAFAVLARVAGVDERAVAAEQISMMPKTPGAGAVLLVLVGDPGSLSKKTRHELFFVIAAALLVVEGDPAAVRDLAAAHSRHLEPRTRRGLESLVRAYTADPDAFQPPLPPPLTVYDICSGDWAGASEQEGDDEEEPLPRPGRNDPCWCGSGKKYKKCHLAEDEAE